LLSFFNNHAKIFGSTCGLNGMMHKDRSTTALDIPIMTVFDQTGPLYLFIRHAFKNLSV